MKIIKKGVLKRFGIIKITNNKIANYFLTDRSNIGFGFAVGYEIGKKSVFLYKMTQYEGN